MKRYQAVCDDHGPLGPVRPDAKLAARDGRQHSCTSADSSLFLRIAHTAVAEAIRQHPSAAHIREELLSDALLGVAQAHANFDASRGVPFGAHALRRARGAILDGFRQRGYVSRNAHRAGVTAADLPPAARPPVSIEDLADHLGLPSFSIQDPRAARAFDAIDDALSLPTLLEPLTGQERTVVVEYFLNQRRMAEIAQQLQVTESRVSQVMKAALTRLRETAPAAA